MIHDEMQWPSRDPHQSRLESGAQCVRGRLLELYGRSAALHEFIRRLEGLGRTLLVGGAPRDWIMGREHKDLDFVVDASTEVLDALVPVHTKMTRFGGHRFQIDGIDLDVWSFATTCTLNRLAPGIVGIGDFLEIVPFNADAIGYDIGAHRLLENGFFRCMDEHVLRRVFVDGHPDQAYCERRARALLKKYALSPSPDLLYFLQERERVRTNSK